MIDFSHLRSIDRKNYKFSIDTLTKTVRKKAINKYISNESFYIKEVKAHSKISSNVKKKLWTREVTSSYQVHTPYFKNITLETPHALNQESNYRKYLLTAFGLSQPNKPLHEKTKRELAKLFNKFGVDSFDLAIDLNYPINTNVLNKFGVITRYENTMYINTPIFSYITKLKYYDKSLQQQLKKPLYRLELTIQTHGKLKDMFIADEELHQIIEAMPP